MERRLILDGVPMTKTKYGNEVIDYEKYIGMPIKFHYEGIDGVVTIEKYDNGYVWVRYLDEEIYRIEYKNFMKCKFRLLLIKYTSGYSVGENIVGDYRNVTILDICIKNKRSTITYKCNICGNIGESSTVNFRKLKYCNACSNRSIVLGINTIYDTDPWMMEIGLSEEDAKKYVKTSNVKVVATCKHCGKSKEVLLCSLYKYKKLSCYCSDGTSFPEKFLYSALTQLNLGFNTEVRFDWSEINFKDKKRFCRYDFVIDKLIIEIDGAWHTTYNNLNKLTSEDSKFIDSEKDRLAIENGYNVIRIDACKSDRDFIKNSILTSNLKSIYNLKLIDWNECLKYALGNRVKEIIEFRKSNMELSLKEVANKFNISKSTIYSYMKRAHDIGWINYDKNLERQLAYKHLD